MSNVELYFIAPVCYDMYMWWREVASFTIEMLKHAAVWYYVRTKLCSLSILNKDIALYCIVLFHRYGCAKELWWY